MAACLITLASQAGPIPKPAELLGRAGFDEIALRRTADNRLFISGKWDGHRGSFLVDSGWSYTTVNDARETGSVTLGEIKLGRMTFTDQPAKQSPVLMGGKRAAFDVALGLDFLRRHSHGATRSSFGSDQRPRLAVRAAASLIASSGSATSASFRR